MRVNLLNIPNNQYNRMFKKALLGQKRKSKVWGKIDWRPQKEYYTIPRSEVATLQALISNPATPLPVKLSSRVKLRMARRDGTLEYGADKNLRAPANPTSSAIEFMQYDKTSGQMRYKFRRNPKMYITPMNQKFADDWMTSNSIGRYFGSRIYKSGL